MVSICDLPCRNLPVRSRWSSGHLVADGLDILVVSITRPLCSQTVGCSPPGVTTPIGFLISAEIYDSGTGTWSPTGSMNTARLDHTATRLSDGRVLVTGGRDDSGELASAEIYDPVRDLVADGLDEDRSCPSHGHPALRQPGARHRGAQCLGQRGDLHSGHGHLVAYRLDEYWASLPHGHATRRHPGARHRGGK